MVLLRAVLASLAILAGACTTSSAAPAESPFAPSSPPVATAHSPSPSLATATVTVGPSAVPTHTVQPADGPSVARLSAEGGDPVTGQLGTYIWHDQGSDSPWLPGAPIAVGRGEPLTVGLAPATSVAAWQARIVPADTSGPTGATLLAKGSGTPRFDAPRHGAWTLEVHLVFGDAAGDASYFWRLDVR